MSGRTPVIDDEVTLVVRVDDAMLLMLAALVDDDDELEYMICVRVVLLLHGH